MSFQWAFESIWWWAPTCDVSAKWQLCSATQKVTIYSIAMPQTQWYSLSTGSRTFNSRCQTYISGCNQPPKANSAFHPSGVGKWVPASAGKAKAGMLHSVSGLTWGVQVKLWDPLKMCAIPEHLRGVFMTRSYTNLRLPYLILPSPVSRTNRLHSSCTML